MMTTKRVIDELALQPTLQDLKDHLRLTDDSQDKMLMGYLKSAILQAEHMISRTLASSSYILSGACAEIIKLPSSPDVTVYVTSVIVDGTDVDYELIDNVVYLTGPGGNKISVSYRAEVAYIEQDIQQAILLMAARHFNNPLDSVDSLPTASSNLLAPYRRYGLED